MEINEEYQSTWKIVSQIRFDHSKGKQKRAVFVMVQNEGIFLPIWLSYYSKYFDPGGIFVFDHISTDGSAEKCLEMYDFQLIKLDYPYSFDHKWVQFAANSIQQKLLEGFEWVMFTDVDEIIFPDPRFCKRLDDFIDSLDSDCIRCFGYELVHIPKKEAPFDNKKPILKQRAFWYRNQFFGKTLLSRVPLHWQIGNHHVSIGNPAEDPRLILIHLHKLDYEMCKKKSADRAKLKWKQEDISTGRGWQNRITNDKSFNSYYWGPLPLHRFTRWLATKRIPAYIRQSGLF